jgi:hypothetical protein
MEALTKARDTIQNDMNMQSLISEAAKNGKLDDIIDNLPGGGKAGRASGNRVLMTAKILVPEIEEIENGVKLLQNLYTYMTSQFAVAYAKAFHNADKEYAELDHVGFKAAVEGALKMAKTADTQQMVNQRALEMAQQMVIFITRK